MKKLKTFYTVIYIFIAMRGQKFKAKLIESLIKLKTAFATESVETKEMLNVYLKYSKGKSSKEEMNKANEQFRDLARALGIGIFAFLPFAPITIPFIVKLGKRLGIEILPSAFREDK